jgi:hypothetical protein
VQELGLIAVFDPLGGDPDVDLRGERDDAGHEPPVVLAGGEVVRRSRAVSAS